MKTASQIKEEKYQAVKAEALSKKLSEIEQQRKEQGDSERRVSHKKSTFFITLGLLFAFAALAFLTVYLFDCFGLCTNV